MRAGFAPGSMRTHSLERTPCGAGTVAAAQPAFGLKAAPGPL